jgi:hypothetical protein
VSAPFWEEQPETWDTLHIAGQRVPGVAHVTGTAARKIDTRSAAGADGARVRDRGYEPAALDVQIRIWTEEQLEELEQILEPLHPRQRGTERTPVDVAHPGLAMLGIRSAYVTAVGIPQISGGVMTLTVRLLEWTAAPRAAPRPSTTSEGGAWADGRTALDASREAALPAPELPARLQ